MQDTGAAVWVPEDLELRAPGPELGVLLAGIDRSRLSADEVISVARARARQVAYEQAQLLADVFAIGTNERVRAAERDPMSWGTSRDGFAADEVATALTWTGMYSQTQLGLAWRVWERLPALGEAMCAGDLDLLRAKVLCDGLAGLDDLDVERRIVELILPVASRLTTGRLKARLARLVITADTRAAKKRYDKGLQERRVERFLQPDGTAGLGAWSLPTDLAAAADQRLDGIATSLKNAGDTRTMDQLRADTFLDLTAGRTHHRQNRRLR